MYTCIIVLLVGFLAAATTASIGLAISDRRLFQRVLALASCLLFAVFCIALFLLLRGRVPADNQTPFALLIPLIATIQFVAYTLRRRPPNTQDDQEKEI